MRNPTHFLVVVTCLAVSLTAQAQQKTVNSEADAISTEQRLMELIKTLEDNPTNNNAERDNLVEKLRKINQRLSQKNANGQASNATSPTGENPDRTALIPAQVAENTGTINADHIADSQPVRQVKQTSSAACDTNIGCLTEFGGNGMPEKPAVGPMTKGSLEDRVKTLEAGVKALKEQLDQANAKILWLYNKFEKSADGSEK